MNKTLDNIKKVTNEIKSSNKRTFDDSKVERGYNASRKAVYDILHNNNYSQPEQIMIASRLRLSINGFLISAKARNAFVDQIKQMNRVKKMLNIDDFAQFVQSKHDAKAEDAAEQQFCSAEYLYEARR